MADDLYHDPNGVAYPKIGDIVKHGRFTGEVMAVTNDLGGRVWLRDVDGIIEVHWGDGKGEIVRPSPDRI